MNDKFDYTYSAPTENQRREIESIKKQYEQKTQTEDKLETLRNLNDRVKRPPFICALIIAIIGVLVMGLGMTMVLEWDVFVWGIVVGIVGIAIAVCAYPVYRVILGKLKSKYAKQIIDLSNELLNADK